MRQVGLFSIRCFFFLCMVAFIGTGVARADGTVYTLVGTSNPAYGPAHPEDFQFTSPGLITSAVNLTGSQLNYCDACYPTGAVVQFFPTGTVNTIVPVDYIRFTDANGIVFGFFFDPGDFAKTGTYTTSDFLPYITSNVGTLTVQATPEPGIALLLAVGLLGLLGAVHMRKLLPIWASRKVLVPQR